VVRANNNYAQRAKKKKNPRGTNRFSDVEFVLFILYNNIETKKQIIAEKLNYI